MNSTTSYPSYTVHIKNTTAISIVNNPIGISILIITIVAILFILHLCRTMRRNSNEHPIIYLDKTYIV